MDIIFHRIEVHSRFCVSTIGLPGMPDKNLVFSTELQFSLIWPQMLFVIIVSSHITHFLLGQRTEAVLVFAL